MLDRYLGAQLQLTFTISDGVIKMVETAGHGTFNFGKGVDGATAGNVSFR